ncbi:MAG: hypothetical protein Fur0020_13400 [Thermodesulfovibrionia bacterium]
MFDLGTQELIVIFIVVLLVFGPKKLPELARAIGRGVNELKAAMRGVKESIEEADVVEEIKKARESVEKELIKAGQVGVNTESHGVEGDKTSREETTPPEITTEDKKEDG